LPDVEALTPAARKAAERTQNPSFSMAPLNAYAEVVARPLFTPTRRPAAQQTAAGRPSDFSLVGIVITRRERHALLEHGRPPHVDRVTPGQNVDGWTVKSIGPNSVLLAQGDRETEIKATAQSTRGVVPVPGMPRGVGPVPQPPIGGRPIQPYPLAGNRPQPPEAILNGGD
jgi:hypothetical protein